ncbi:fused DSP-PTPase phosphatase/NAD kinase-like protein [Loktanella sp. Alg231-35]|uniref:fused DSP-PTPase phosphatase/NAD kinase-like protein n=1 Tax=Loktanella sp. Alg231-35 TaxID=1922220 RepID=UPI001F466520|nr:tyrosine-protein phosphatase [Loktanella sp. Alg231-35]
MVQVTGIAIDGTKMIRKILSTLDKKERDLRKSMGRDITDPADRKRAQRSMMWLDHGVLRLHWHNFDKVADGVYRSNHPDHKRFAAYAKMGITTVLNLRGGSKDAHYLFEKESCEQLGLHLVSIQMSARKSPHKEPLLRLFSAFETMDRPFLLHCKSGADRTGLVAALYLMIHEGASVAVARKQLSFRYLHIRRSSTGILDHFLDVYAARHAETGIGIIDWIRDEYDRDALTASFAAKQAALKPWQGW